MKWWYIEKDIPDDKIAELLFLGVKDYSRPGVDWTLLWLGQWNVGQVKIESRYGRFSIGYGESGVWYADGPLQSVKINASAEYDFIVELPDIELHFEGWTLIQR